MTQNYPTQNQNSPSRPTTRSSNPNQGDRQLLNREKNHLQSDLSRLESQIPWWETAKLKFWTESLNTAKPPSMSSSRVLHVHLRWTTPSPINNTPLPPGNYYLGLSRQQSNTGHFFFPHKWKCVALLGINIRTSPQNIPSTNKIY